MFPLFEERVADMFIDEGVCNRVPLIKIEERTMSKVFEQKGSEMLLDGKYLTFLAPAIEDPDKTELLSVHVRAYRAYYPGLYLRLL